MAVSDSATALPLAGRPWIVVAVATYVAVVLAIGVWSARRTRSERDFFIAGQGIGLVVTALATMAAAFSGFALVGGPGLAYRIGLSSLWIVLPVSFTGGLLCWVVGRRLRALAAVREVYTVPDALACRFGGRATPGLAAIAVALGTLGYLAAQLLALGVLLQAIFGFGSLAAGMAIGLVVLLAYAVFGGMIAGVYTDVVQGGLMMGAGVAVFVAAVGAAGGWRELTRAIATSEAFGPEFLEPLGGLPPYTAFGFLFVFGVGVLGQPHLLHKFYMLDDPHKLRWLPLVLASSQVLCLLLWVGIGLGVPALVARGALPPLARPDDTTPTFLLTHASDVLAGLVLTAVLAAIMSTADSLVNIGAGALVRDLPRALGRPLGRELAWGRAAVAGLAVGAAVLGHAWGDLIALLGTFAFGTFAAALAPAVAVGLCWERVPAVAAAVSIATGLVLNLGLELLGRRGGLGWLPEGVLPSAVALAASFAVLFAVTACAPPNRIDADVRAALE
jgi:Na+/proline symporter